MNSRILLRTLYELKFICMFCKNYGQSNKGTPMGNLGWCSKHDIWVYEFNPKCKEF